MPIISVTPGVDIETDGDYRVSNLVGNSLRAKSLGETYLTKAVDLGLRRAQFKTAAEVIITPNLGSRKRHLRSKAAAPKVQVLTKPGEAAVLLVESQDGVLEWVFHDQQANRLSSSAKRSISQRSTLNFTLDHVGGIGGRGKLSGKKSFGRGLRWFRRRITGPIKVRVLRFFANRTIDYLMRRIDGAGPFGLIDMRKANVSSWVAPAELDLSTQSAQSVLLFLHGTFSSTIGSFAALTATPEGRSFLASANEKYDNIIGFDHKTLADNPEENALELAKSLQSLPANSRVDIICFSRGALIARSLMRAPNGLTNHLRFGQVVFVGSTNGGTQLAEPDNWKRLLDLYINIGAGAGRAFQLVGLPVAGIVIAKFVEVLGRFVQALPTIAISEERVPGLASMEPDGEFIKRLNDGTEVVSEFSAVTSDFEPKGRSARGLPTAMLQLLADGFVDGLMREENDLVVDRENMTDFGGASLDNDRVLHLDEEEAIYHTIYFTNLRTIAFVQEALLS